MSPRRAETYIKSFHLPNEEELFLIECDVRDRSVVSVAMEYGFTPDTVKRKRRRAYAHIADELNNERTG